MKTKILLTVLGLFSNLAFAQTMYLSGPSTVSLNDRVDYYANWDFAPDEGEFYWNAEGGTVINPDWYWNTCEVEWTVGEYGWVYYLYETWDNYWEDSYQVYVNAPTPGAPTATQATHIGALSFIANWSSVNGASSYRIDASTSSTFSNFLTYYNNTTVLGTSVYVDRVVSPRTTYYYRVRAANGSGVSGNSNTISVLTLPGAPIMNNATNITTNSFVANWNSAQSATSYRLDVSTTSTFSSFVTGYNNLSLTGTSQSVTGLSAGTTYYYRVRAINGTGTSANSATTSQLLLPAAPVVSAATSVTATSFTANWASVTSATSYRLDVSTSSTFSSLVSGYNNLSVNNTSQNVTGLSAGTTYYYRVRAVNGTALLRTPAPCPDCFILQPL